MICGLGVSKEEDSSSESVFKEPMAGDPSH